jgi:hypothetical protein
MVNYAVCSFTRFVITGRENANGILSKRQCCERRNFRKKLRFSIIILRMKKLPKQDEFDILG